MSVGTDKIIVGCAQPRLETPPLRPLNCKTSLGFEVIDFANLIGEPFLPWQEYAVIHALELLPDRSFRFRTVLILCARQNGKSSLKRTVSLWRMYIEKARLVLGVAQDVSLAREQWSYCLDTINASPELKPELDKVRSVNGDEWFRLANGARYKLAASNRKAGRGLSVDELNIDELREQQSWDSWSALSKTTMAREHAQTWAMSNAGDDRSVVLNQLRESALSGRDQSICLLEWSAPDGCDLDDPQAWAQANPGLGHTITEAAIRSALGTDPPQVFRTEVLCQRVVQLEGAIDLASWRSCADPGGSMDAHRDAIAAGFDVSFDGMHATLAVAAKTADNRVRIEIVKAWKSVEEARADIVPLLDKIKPISIMWYPTGPGAGFAQILRARHGSVEITGQAVAIVCQQMADMTKAKELLHSGDPLLDSHVGGATRHPTVDGWRFARRGDAAHVDAAYAAAAAIQGALTTPEPRTPRFRVLNW